MAGGRSFAERTLRARLSCGSALAEDRPVCYDAR